MIAELENHKPDLEELCRRHHVARLELFGSAAAGHARRNRTDLDFLVEFGPLLGSGYADSYFGLLEALEHLLGQPVDLVVATAIQNPYFRQSVEQTKSLIYAA